MANFFYTDAIGRKQGPVNEQQLKGLVTQGVVKPDTPLETDTGHKGVASQIPGLFAAAPSPPVQSTTPPPVSVPPPLESSPPVASWQERISTVATKGAEWGKEVYQKAKPHVSIAAEKIQNMVSPPGSSETGETSDSFGRGSYRLNYERNKIYFQPFPSVFVVMIGAVVAIMGFVMLKSGLDNQAGTSMFVFGLIIAAGGFATIAYAVRRLQDRVTDEEIDETCADYIRYNLKSMALEKLGIVEEQVQEAEPIQVSGYFYRAFDPRAQYLKLHPLAPRAEKRGQDGALRTSSYNAVMYFFTQDQVLGYEFVFSLLEDKKQERTDEYFYGDIVSISTDRSPADDGVASAAQAISQLGGIGAIAKLLWGTKKPSAKIDYFETFRLTTSGGTYIEATFSDSGTFKRSIDGMKGLLRSKKQHLQR